MVSARSGHFFFIASADAAANPERPRLRSDESITEPMKAIAKSRPRDVDSETNVGLPWLAGTNGHRRCDPGATSSALRKRGAASMARESAGEPAASSVCPYELRSRGWQ
jgi:hypothetical protein